MSLAAYRWAWDTLGHHPDLTYGAKVALLCLAEHHNESSGRLHPSHARIARMTGLTRRGVQKAIQQLADAGLLKVVARTQGGAQLSNCYVLAMTRRPSPARRRRGANADTREPANSPAQGGREPPFAAQGANPGSHEPEGSLYGADGRPVAGVSCPDQDREVRVVPPPSRGGRR